MHKSILASMVVVVFSLPVNAADRYRAGANVIACNDKPAMIEFVKAIHADQTDLAASIAGRTRSAGASCTVFSEGEFVLGTPTGFGLIYVPDGGYYAAIDGFDPAPHLPMTGGWKCDEPVGLEKEMGRKSATNTSQRLTLTQVRERTILGLFIPDGGRWMMANTLDKIVFEVDGGKAMTRVSELGHPELALDSELASALKRGLNVSISLISEEGNTHRFNSSLVGFTRAYDCVQQPF